MCRAMRSIHVYRGQVYECNGMERDGILASVFGKRARFSIRNVGDGFSSTPQLSCQREIRFELVEESGTEEGDQNGNQRPPAMAKDVLPLGSQPFTTVAWNPHPRIRQRTSSTPFPFKTSLFSDQLRSHLLSKSPDQTGLFIGFRGSCQVQCRRRARATRFCDARTRKERTREVLVHRRLPKPPAGCLRRTQAAPHAVRCPPTREIPSRARCTICKRLPCGS